MVWDQITAWLDAFTNKPIVITITGVLTALVPLFVIFKNTSFGKKAINKLTRLYTLGEERSQQTLKKVEEVEKFAKEEIASQKAYYEQKVEDIKNDCEQKVAFALSVVNFYEESVFSILEEIPNAHVQEKLNIFKATYQEKKKAISDSVGVIYQDYELALENSKNEIEQKYQDKIDYLENQLKQLQLYFNEVKGEPNNGEREEETNSNPTEETLQDSCESL